MIFSVAPLKFQMSMEFVDGHYCSGRVDDCARVLEISRKQLQLAKHRALFTDLRDCA